MIGAVNGGTRSLDPKPRGILGVYTLAQMAVYVENRPHLASFEALEVVPSPSQFPKGPST